MSVTIVAEFAGLFVVGFKTPIQEKIGEVRVFALDTAGLSMAIPPHLPRLVVNAVHVKAGIPNTVIDTPDGNEYDIYDLDGLCGFDLGGKSPDLLVSTGGRESSSGLWTYDTPTADPPASDTSWIADLTRLGGANVLAAGLWNGGLPTTVKARIQLGTGYLESLVSFPNTVWEFRDINNLGNPGLPYKQALADGVRLTISRLNDPSMGFDIGGHIITLAESKEMPGPVRLSFCSLPVSMPMSGTIEHFGAYYELSQSFANNSAAVTRYVPVPAGGPVGGKRVFCPVGGMTDA